MRFVIFMVNLKSRSCWLILLVDGKTRRNCRPCRDSNRHFMLNYSWPEQKEEPDFAILRPRDQRKRSRSPDSSSTLATTPVHVGNPVQLVKVPGAQPQRDVEQRQRRRPTLHLSVLFQSFLWEASREKRCLLPFLGHSSRLAKVTLGGPRPCRRGLEAGGGTAAFPREPVSRGRGSGPFQRPARAGEGRFPHAWRARGRQRRSVCRGVFACRWGRVSCPRRLLHATPVSLIEMQPQEGAERGRGC